MNSVRFRYPVFPNCRLVIAARAQKVRPKRRAEFEFQGFVDGRLVFNGEMIGVPIMKNQGKSIK
jgi:3-hydroxyacyl-[acyl-carrier-protein] dehydratase